MSPPTAWPLRLSQAEMIGLGQAAVDFVACFHAQTRPTASTEAPDPDLMKELGRRPEDDGESLGQVLALLGRAAAYGFDTTGSGYMAFVPGGGLYSSALADFIALALNRFVGSTAAAPACVRIEESVVRWIASLFGLPAESQGILTSGGSVAHLSAMVTAREARLGGELARGRVYISAEAHQSIAKAARLAGLPPGCVRTVPVGTDLKLDVTQLEQAIHEDRAQGWRPFLVVGTAGTTNTGAVDPLPALAALARREGLWFHVDAAYGGFFQLTSRGFARLRGIEQADSIAVDPHKSLFLPYGTGALVVRDGEHLRAAHQSQAGAYLADVRGQGTRNFADHSIELTREFRGLRVWLPLRIHGLNAFRDCLDGRLDLAERAHHSLSALNGLELPWRPELATVAFRCAPAAFGDAELATRRLLEAVNGSGRVMISSTVVGGRLTLRACMLSHRLTPAAVDDLVEQVAEFLCAEPAGITFRSCLGVPPA